MPLDITKPAVIILLNEIYEKEKRLRAQWVAKHREKIQLAATLQREPTNYYEEDVIQHNMFGGLATITRDHVTAGYNRRKVPLRDAASMPTTKDLRQDNTIIKMGLGDATNDPRLARSDTDLSPDPIMRPVDPKLKRLLYKPRPRFGREVYLQKRNKDSPENKYYFPELSSWDYGWRVSDSGMKQASRHGRCWLLTRSLCSRVGPQPDPHHYQSADQPNMHKCVSL